MVALHFGRALAFRICELEKESKQLLLDRCQEAHEPQPPAKLVWQGGPADRVHASPQSVTFTACLVLWIAPLTVTHVGLDQHHV